MEINVICIKWGKKYSAKYVNTLHGMVSRNLKMPHRFICFTDDSQDLKHEIEVFPIPDLGFEIVGPERCWRKLAVFKKGLAEMRGKCLFLDLDVVIVDDISDFFTQGNEFRLCFENHRKRRFEGNSSVMHFTANCYHEILDSFLSRPTHYMNTYRHEQSFISNFLLHKNLLGFWPKVWTPTFKYHCVPKFPFNFFKPTFIPQGSKIVLFHGLPNPSDAVDGNSGKWYRRFKKSPWILNYWNA